jgi:hypothetical protein
MLILEENWKFLQQPKKIFSKIGQKWAINLILKSSFSGKMVLFENVKKNLKSEIYINEEHIKS